MRKVAIFFMVLGFSAFFILVGQSMWAYEVQREEEFRLEACTNAAVVIATTTICLKDKDFKCFVTPKDYQEFARAIEKHKTNNCEVK